MELNREQIIKALECCSSGGNCITCREDALNPRLSKEGCMAVQMRNALSLIKELAEENERLKAEKKADLEKFAERIKRYYTTLNGKTNSNLVAYHIDQVIKEMTGEEAQ